MHASTCTYMNIYTHVHTLFSLRFPVFLTSRNGGVPQGALRLRCAGAAEPFHQLLRWQTASSPMSGYICIYIYIRLYIYIYVYTHICIQYIDNIVCFLGARGWGILVGIAF